jgi:hypothetical protein
MLIVDWPTKLTIRHLPTPQAEHRLSLKQSDAGGRKASALYRRFFVPRSHPSRSAGSWATPYTNHALLDCLRIHQSKTSRSPIVMSKEYATDGCSGKINSGQRPKRSYIAFARVGGAFVLQNSSVQDVADGSFTSFPRCPRYVRCLSGDRLRAQSLPAKPLDNCFYARVAASCVAHDPGLPPRPTKNQ